jgi:hypothetical protein
MIKSQQKRVLNLFKRELTTYKQVKNRFFEIHSDFTKIIKIHFIRTGENERSFTVDFGVTVPKILEVLWKSSDYLKHGPETGVFHCNIHGIITDFSGKPWTKYWDLPSGEETFQEISQVIREKLVPFSEKFGSLEILNNLVNTTNYPFKYTAMYPIMNLCLKYLLHKDNEFYELATELRKLNRGFYVDKVDELVKLKEATTGNKMFMPAAGDALNEA